jgi:hypothetical protein
MPESNAFIVELTSGNPNDPEKINVDARDAAQAIRVVLSGGYPEVIPELLRPYTPETDPTGSYTGWSYITISVGPAIVEEDWNRPEPRPRTEAAS